MSSYDLDSIQDGITSPPPQTPAITVHPSTMMPPTQPLSAPLQGNFSTARPLNLLHKVNNAGAAGIQEATVITNPSANNQPTNNSLLPALVPLPSGVSFIQAQRLEAPATTVSEFSTRLIDSLFSTDVYEFTDLPLLTWFRKNQVVTEGEVPFFSTPTLAKLMLKENYEMKNYVTSFQTKINDLSSIHCMAALVALTEQIFKRQLILLGQVARAPAEDPLRKDVFFDRTFNLLSHITFAELVVLEQIGQRMC
jgi:hypothetical protein